MSILFEFRCNIPLAGSSEETEDECRSRIENNIASVCLKQGWTLDSIRVIKPADSKEAAAREKTDSEILKLTEQPSQRGGHASAYDQSNTFHKVPMEETEEPNYEPERTKELEKYREYFVKKLQEFEASRQLLWKIEKVLACSICQNTVRQPNTLDCGHSFCCRCISKWARRGRRNGSFCPVCHRPLSSSMLVLVLRDIADDIRACFQEQEDEEVSDDAETERSSNSDEDDDDEFFDAWQELP